ncbi:MAG: FHA domain-containing protein [Myxococcales bacterium]|jgi:hypothetical protein
MTEATRIVRLGAMADRSDAMNEGTKAAPILAELFSLPRLFNKHQEALAGALRAEPRPGVMFFMLSPAEVEGTLWLAATEELRVGFIGRHGCVDLYLPKDATLSLRHCLALVRRLDNCVRLHVLDLSSSRGLRTEENEPIHAIDADGHVLLRVPGGILACFPTGVALPWNPAAAAPFASLAPRVVSAKPGRPQPRWGPCRSETGVSRVQTRPGPMNGPGALLLRGEVPAGRLTVDCGDQWESILIGPRALDRGVLIGRDSRCAGSMTLVADRVSRVHALLIRRDETLFLADVGSTNGIWLDDETEVRCARVTPETAYRLGEVASIRWEPSN